jgi:hypothetical protein
MGLHVEYLDTAVIRSRIQMALHTVMIDCVIEHVPIIGVGDLPTPYTHNSPVPYPCGDPEARRPDAVVRTRLRRPLPWYRRTSLAPRRRLERRY